MVGVDDGTFVRDPLLGQTVGEYQVVRRIGAGGMGIVYEARHPVIGKRAAVKVLKPEVAEDPEQMERLLSEAKAIASINHQAVIDIFGFGQLPDGHHYMVMEYLDGEPLDLLLQRAGKLPLGEALAIVDKIASGLGAAHAVGVVHRDLKPSNVILVSHVDGTREVKVLDFGLAKAGKPHESVPQTIVGRVQGTPEYMAPEQARGLAVGPRTDLYALGVIAFELVVGDVPFDGPSPMEIMLKQVREPPPRPSSREPALPSSFDDFIARLMAKSPDDRPASADEVRQLIARLSQPAPATRPRPSRPRASAEHSRPGPPPSMVEGTEPVGRALPAPVEPALEPPGLDATQRELPQVATSTDQVRALEPTQPGGPTAPRVLQPRPERKRPARASDEGPVGDTAVASAETAEVQNPTRAPTPLVALGLLAAVVLAVLAWALWPAEGPADVLPIPLERPLSVDPSKAKFERAPGVDPLPPTPTRPVPAQEPTAPQEPALEATPGPAPDATPPTEAAPPTEPSPAPAAAPTPVRRPAEDLTSQRALMARVRGYEKRLGANNTSLAAKFLRPLREELEGKPGPDERRRLAAELDQWEAQYLKAR